MIFVLAIGADHGGYELKEQIKAHLDEKGVEYKDFGTYSEESCDYPLYAAKVCEAVQKGECEAGILVCGTGIGMSIAANKFDGIRCALLTNSFSARLTKEHNNANVIALGGRVTASGIAMDIVDSYLDAKFQGGRHQKRIDLITELEK